MKWYQRLMTPFSTTQYVRTVGYKVTRFTSYYIFCFRVAVIDTTGN